MVFIESAVFTRQVRELLTDEEYTGLQWHLALDPKAGEVMQGTGGLRKVRWTSGDLLSRHEPESGATAADLS